MMKLSITLSLGLILSGDAFTPPSVHSRSRPLPTTTGSPLLDSQQPHELMSERDTMVVLNQAGYCLEEGCPPIGKEGKHKLLCTLSEQDLILTERVAKIDRVLNDLDNNIEESHSYSETASNYLHHLELMNSLDKAVPHTHAKARMIVDDDHMATLYQLAEECIHDECTVEDKEAVLKPLIEQRHAAAARIAEIEKLMKGLGASKQEPIGPLLLARS
jgi:hypothetical protein